MCEYAYSLKDHVKKLYEKINIKLNKKTHKFRLKKYTYR